MNLWRSYFLFCIKGKLVFNSEINYQAMKNCYVLFVKTGCEEEIVERLKSNSLLKPFAPMKEYFFIRKGVADKRRKVCFQGYVFVESNLLPEEFINLFAKRNPWKKDIIRILNYGDYLNIAMKREEHEAIINMFSKNYCLNVSTAKLVGNRVQIISGPLLGMESTIKKVNAKKKEAALEIEFMGYKRLIWVGLEIIKGLDQ